MMLNQSTLLLFQAGVTALTTLLLVLQAVAAGAQREQRLWAAGNLTACLGLLISTLGDLPDIIHGGLSYGLIGLGMALVLRGLFLFCGRDLSNRAVIAISVLAFALPACFVVFYPSLAARLAVTGVYFGVLNFYCAYVLLQEWQRTGRYLMWVSVAGFAAFGVALLVRGLYVVVSPEVIDGTNTNSTVINVTLFITSLAQVAIFSGMLMMIAQRYAEQLSRMSMLDPLSGAYNRNGLMSLGARMLTRARASGRPVAVAMVDADHFKTINDTYGHPAGDEVLRQLAELMQGLLRPNDMVIRFGGEEFLLLLDGTALSGALGVVERLRAKVEASQVIAEGHTIAYTISIGLATSEHCGYDLKALTAAADSGVYQAKQTGRNRICVGQPK